MGMFLHKANTYRLYPTPGQARQIAQIAGSCWFVQLSRISAKMGDTYFSRNAFMACHLPVVGEQSRSLWPFGRFGKKVYSSWNPPSGSLDARTRAKRAMSVCTSFTTSKCAPHADRLPVDPNAIVRAVGSR